MGHAQARFEFDGPQTDAYCATTLTAVSLAANPPAAGQGPARALQFDLSQRLQGVTVTSAELDQDRLPRMMRIAAILGLSIVAWLPLIALGAYFVPFW